MISHDLTVGIGKTMQRKYGCRCLQQRFNLEDSLGFASNWRSQCVVRLRPESMNCIRKTQFVVRGKIHHRPSCIQITRCDKTISSQNVPGPGSPGCSIASCYVVEETACKDEVSVLPSRNHSVSNTRMEVHIAEHLLQRCYPSRYMIFLDGIS
jgi:hypothetical protein